jgi:hypothetical protein
MCHMTIDPMCHMTIGHGHFSFFGGLYASGVLKDAETPIKVDQAVNMHPDSFLRPT